MVRHGLMFINYILKEFNFKVYIIIYLMVHDLFIIPLRINPCILEYIFFIYLTDGYYH